MKKYYTVYIYNMIEELNYNDSHSIATLVDNDITINLYREHLTFSQDKCNVVFRFSIDESKFYDYVFLKDIPFANYLKIRSNLILISTLGITDKETISIKEHSNYCSIISLSILYWHRIISKTIPGLIQYPFMLEFVPKKLQLYEIYIYKEDNCIERISVDS